VNERIRRGEARAPPADITRNESEHSLACIANDPYRSDDCSPNFATSDGAHLATESLEVIHELPEAA